MRIGRRFSPYNIPALRSLNNLQEATLSGVSVFVCAACVPEITFLSCQSHLCVIVNQLAPRASPLSIVADALIDSGVLKTGVVKHNQSSNARPVCMDITLADDVT